MAEQTAMKAWKVWDNWGEGSTVVFAETRGKAHALARSTDCCEDSEWNDIHVRRFPEMDKMWKPGKWEMDWYDPEDRTALVKCGWSCLEPEYEDCEHCPAKEWCCQYEDAKEDLADGL